MHLKSSLLPLTLLFPALISASLQPPSHNHNHKRVLSRRAGAPINGTDPDSTWSINLGHQATSSSVGDDGPTRTAGEQMTTTTGGGGATQTQDVESSSSIMSPSTSSVVVVVTPSSSSTLNPTNSLTSSSLSTSSTPTTSSTLSTPSTSSTSSLTTSTFTQPAQQTSIIRSTQFQSHSSAPTLLSASATVSAGNSSANAASSEDDKGGSHKLSVGKTAMIVIIVVASVIVGAIAIWTIIRKWKLAPSKKFDERMNPLDFSDNHMGDAFYEKTRRRQSNHSINSTASAQRRALAHDLDADAEKYGHHDQGGYTHGVPNHDFTAGPASSGYGNGNYDPYGYPPQPHGQSDYGTYADEAVGGAGQGYANLRRGPSSAGTNFAGMGAGAAGLNQPGQYQQDQGVHSQMAGHYDQEERLYDQSTAQGGMGAGYGIPGDEGLGRPTRGEGPYFAASQVGQGRGY